MTFDSAKAEVEHIRHVDDRVRATSARKISRCKPVRKTSTVAVSVNRVAIAGAASVSSIGGSAMPLKPISEAAAVPVN